MRGLRGRRKTRINYKKMMVSMAIIIFVVALVFFGIGRLSKGTHAPEVGESQSRQEEKKVIPEDKTFNLVAIRRYNVP